MEKETKSNSKAWSRVYETTSFGNEYPTDGLVSLFYHFIKNELDGLDHQVKVLDFGCSHGANADFFRKLGFDVYGIDISSEAVKYCIEKRGFDRDKFKACDILGEKRSIEKMYGKFDIIVASECLYYFSKNDFHRLLQVFYECMHVGSVIYANMHTWNCQLYRHYKGAEVNEEGMVRIESSGTAELPLWVHIVEDKNELRNLFGKFQELATVRTVLEMESENETLHFIGKK